MVWRNLEQISGIFMNGVSRPAFRNIYYRAGHRIESINELLLFGVINLNLFIPEWHFARKHLLLAIALGNLADTEYPRFMD